MISEKRDMSKQSTMSSMLILYVFERPCRSECLFVRLIFEGFLTNSLVSKRD
jgi:hypothetical protein